MPRAVVYVILFIPSLFDSGKKKLVFRVMIETFIEEITEELGY